jgi:hypothetical protein
MAGILSNISAELLQEVMGAVDYNLLKDADQIMRALTQSKDNKTAVALSADILGIGYFVTGVEEITLGENGGEVVVTLKPYDITGYIFVRRRLKFSEIKGVHPFKSPFENPFIKAVFNGSTEVA